MQISHHAFQSVGVHLTTLDLTPPAIAHFDLRMVLAQGSFTRCIGTAGSSLSSQFQEAIQKAERERAVEGETRAVGAMGASN